MSGVREWIGSALAAGGAAMAAGALAALGVVWLTIALYGALATLMSPPAAMALVGVVCLAPLAVLFLSRRRREPQPATVAPDPLGFDALPMAKLVQSIDGLSNTSPLAGVALAFGAAWVASRSPYSSALAAQLAAEAVERLVRLINESAPATPDPDPPASPQ